MSDAPYAFKVGDRVVLTWLGPDQPEGEVTRINGLKTYPWLYSVTLTFRTGKVITIGPSSLRLSSDRAGLPINPGRPPEPTPPYYPAPARSPLLAPDWEAEDVTEAALAEAVTDWERSVRDIEGDYDCGNAEEELQLDVINREWIHAILLGFSCLNLPVPEDLASRIASADQRFIESTEASHCLWSDQDYDPTAFWYYFRWPISKSPG